MLDAAGSFATAVSQLEGSVAAATHATPVSAREAWAHAAALGAETDAGTSAFPGKLVFHDWALSELSQHTLERLEKDEGFRYFTGPTSLSTVSITNRMSGPHLYITVHGGASADEILGHLPLAVTELGGVVPTALFVMWDAGRYSEVRRPLETIFAGLTFDTHYANHCAVLEKSL